MLTEDEVGIWVLFLNFVAIVEVTKSGFIKNATVRYFNLQEDEQEVTIASLFLNFAFTAVSLILTLAGAAGFYYVGSDPLVASLLLIYCIQSLIYIPFTHFEYQLTAQLNFRVMMNAYLMRNFILFLCLGTAYLLISPQTLTLIHIATFQLLGLALSVVYLWIQIKPRRIPWVLNKSLTKEIANFGKYIFATNISSMLFRSTDQYMLGLMISNASVAYYNVAIRITNLIDLPSTAAAEVLFPKSVKSMQTLGTQDLKRLYEKTVGYVLALVLPMTFGVYLLGDIVIDIIAGKEYQESLPILKITLLYGLMLPFLKQFGTIMNTLDKPKTNFLTVLAIFVVNVVSNYFFIHEFGVIGAAYGTLTTYVVGMVLNQIILRREVTINLFNTLKYTAEAYQEGYKKVVKHIPMYR